MGYRPGFQWSTRLQGLALAAMGLVGLTLAVGVVAAGGPIAARLGLAPIPGAAWLAPAMAAGGLGLVAVGLYRAIRP